GAFVKLSDEINGLIHVTEIPGDVKDPSETMKIGDKVEAKVIAVEPEEHRVGLSIKALTEKAKEETEEEEKAVKKTEKTKAAKEEKEEAEEKETPKKTAKKPIKRTTKKKED
ncbi:MAG TPA: S1 RNA-binding domain-containing protein, partial [Candidatus Gracilibacteria bacterium]|nr:S1 RNA-binding domain-containing protein [Candidatus Gracilibacteria bacterium]